MAVRAAAVQLNSNQDKQRNLATADRLTRAAAADGAQLILLPEKWTALGTDDDYYRAAETLEDGEAVEWARSTARELGVDLVAGSIVERREGRDKLGNTSIHFGPDGEQKAVYRKIHMFDVVVGGLEYRESASEDPGEEIVISETRDGVPLGMTVCYDLRFPELYRKMADEGADILSVPAAFTAYTGRAHWEVLLRARAIENQAYAFAPAQVGAIGPGEEKRRAYGHALVVDPWGEVVSDAGGSGEGFALAPIDPARLAQVRRDLPALKHRRRDLLG